MEPVTVIYVPGLGGKYDDFRSFALRLWPKKYNAFLIPMNWTDPHETFEQKKARLEGAIAASSGQVILVGESAGASIAFIVAHEHPSVKYIGFCGKIGGAATTGEHYYRRVPAFKTMLPLADTTRTKLAEADTRRMVTVRAYKDIFLSKRDNTLPGVKQIVLPSFGHLPSIILGITLLRYGLLKAIKILTK